MNRTANYKTVICCACDNSMEMLDPTDDDPVCPDCQFEWEEEDIDYAREAERDKRLSRGY